MICLTFGARELEAINPVILKTTGMNPPKLTAKALVELSTILDEKEFERLIEKALDKAWQAGMDYVEEQYATDLDNS